MPSFSSSSFLKDPHTHIPTYPFIPSYPNTPSPSKKHRLSKMGFSPKVIVLLCFLFFCNISVEGIRYSSFLNPPPPSCIRYYPFIPCTPPPPPPPPPPCLHCYPFIPSTPPPLPQPPPPPTPPSGGPHGILAWQALSGLFTVGLTLFAYFSVIIKLLEKLIKIIAKYFKIMRRPPVDVPGVGGISSIGSLTMNIVQAPPPQSQWQQSTTPTSSTRPTASNWWWNDDEWW